MTLGGQPDAPPPDDYNRIFETLVDEEPGDHEVVGLIAYALYKREKREWAAGIRKRFNRGPTAAELAEYVATCGPTRLSSYRAQAVSIMSGYASFVIAEEEPRILREAVKGTFWRGVWQSMVAAFFYTLILLGLGVILAIVGVDVLGILRSAGEVVNGG